MSEPFVGQITMFGGNFAPLGWAFCDGQLLAIAQNDALFSLLGTIYGGDGVTTFALPDLRGRIPVHAGSGPGLTPRQLGQKAGAESVTLNVNQIPPHDHGVTAQMRAEGRPGNATDPTGVMLAAGASIYRPNSPAEDVDMDPGAIAVTQQTVGSGQSFGIVPPFQTVHYIIALYGIYPSRN